MQEEEVKHPSDVQLLGDTFPGVWSKPIVRRKTKIVCTIGPSTDTREMIWKLAEAGMNVARLNMSHGDHTSHQKVIDLVKEYNAQTKDNTISIMIDTKVILQSSTQSFCFLQIENNYYDLVPPSYKNSGQKSVLAIYDLFYSSIINSTALVLCWYLLPSFY